MRRLWRLSAASRSADLSGAGAGLYGGRWNHLEHRALYLGGSAAICCLEHFVHTTGVLTVPLHLVCLELPDDPALYFEPRRDSLPAGWDSLPADRSSMDFGTAWLKECQHLGLIVPSVILPQEFNMLINPHYPAASRIKIVSVEDFRFDKRMFQDRHRG